jgi:hypothetical protein
MVPINMRERERERESYTSVLQFCTQGIGLKRVLKKATHTSYIKGRSI